MLNHMMYSVYQLFGLDPTASPQFVLNKCISACDEWTLENVTSRLLQKMPREQALVCVKQVYDEGHKYLKTSASMLMDPSARQCYDAWLDTLSNPTAEKKALTKARFLWYNQQNNTVKFSETMLKSLGDEVSCVKNKKQKKMVPVKPICRECRCNFDFDEPYLVLHCHCTTRVGHNECLSNFNQRCKGKCPVCRQQLLMRSQVSKYLFWNVKEKFKLIL
jgi:hypothetical protein